MDIARWGLKKDRLANSVTSIGGRFGYKDDGETPNTQLSVLDYGDSQIIFEVRGLKTDNIKGATVGVIFYGTQGHVVLTKYTGGAAFDLQGNKVQEFDGGGNHYRNFIDAVINRRSSDLNADILEGHISSALCHVANISYRLGLDEPFSSQSKAFGENKKAYEIFARTQEHLKDNAVPLDNTNYRVGQTLTIDPNTESVPGQPEAQALLTRAYREPFVVPASM